MSVSRTFRHDRPGIIFELTDGDGFQDWLQTELRVRRMSQRQLAARAGVDHSSVSRLLRGGRVPSLRTVLRIAQSVDPDAIQTVQRGPLAERLGRAVARVEYALRADPSLSESDVQDVMYRYLAIRRGNGYAPRTSQPPEHTNGGGRPAVPHRPR